MLVAIARILELGATFKILENQLVRPATHDGPRNRHVQKLNWR